MFFLGALLHSLDKPQIISGYFPQILQRASATSELVVGIVLREDDAAGGDHGPVAPSPPVESAIEATASAAEAVEVTEAAESRVVGSNAAAATEDGGAALVLLLPQEVGLATVILRVCVMDDKKRGG